MSDWSAALADAFDRHLRIERRNTGTTGGHRQVSRLVGGETAPDRTFREAETAKTSETSAAIPSRSEMGRSFSQDAFEERVAFVQESAGVPADWAEAFVRLDQATKRDRSANSRAAQIMDDAGRFLDRWAHKAAALGWSAIDVFGAESISSVAVTGGLVRLINGGVVEAISERRASIRMPDATLVVYVRRMRAAEWRQAGA